MHSRCSSYPAGQEKHCAAVVADVINLADVVVEAGTMMMLLTMLMWPKKLMTLNLLAER